MRRPTSTGAKPSLINPSHTHPSNTARRAGKAPTGHHLDVTKDDKLIQKLMIDDKKCYLFGRNPHMNDFCIDHGSCSRVHAALVYHKHLNISYLVDLGSSECSADCLKLFAGFVPSSSQYAYACHIHNSARHVHRQSAHRGPQTHPAAHQHHVPFWRLDALLCAARTTDGGAGGRPQQHPRGHTNDAGRRRSADRWRRRRPARIAREPNGAGRECGSGLLCVSVQSTITAFFHCHLQQNLTEYNTAHNRRISMLGITDDPVAASNAAKAKAARHPNRRKRHVTFNDEEIVINPEDIDPSVGRFRNLVKSTVVAPVAAKRMRFDPLAGGAVNVYGAQPEFARPAPPPPVGGHSAAYHHLYEDLPPSLSDHHHHHSATAAAAAAAAAAALANRHSGSIGPGSGDLNAKFGIMLPNPAPEVSPLSGADEAAGSEADQEHGEGAETAPHLDGK